MEICINKYSLHNSAIAGSKPGMKKEEDEGIEFALIHLTMINLLTLRGQLTCFEDSNFIFQGVDISI
jgi:hypothetical protein